MHRTPLHAEHLTAGARMVDFSGWEMPLHYGSQLDEHHKVRREAGMFDVSHMMVTDVQGPAARAWLARLLASDAAKLRDRGKALYSCLLREDGGILDDLIVYLLDTNHYRIVSNAGTRAKVSTWLARQAEGHDMALRLRDDLAMIAVQGPKARQRVLSLLEPAERSQANCLNAFFGAQAGSLFIARTGYTGEDGFEIMLPAAAAESFWQRLLQAGVTPCGLGARDTLRLEAGMNLYGTDMDESVSPLESGLGWTVPPDSSRDFIGRAALERQRTQGGLRRFTGLLLQDKGVMRNHLPVRLPDGRRGEVTSGGFSPTLQRSIALARLPAGADAAAEVEIRGRWLAAQILKPPFVRNGKTLIKL
jgi:aminomethyltransferase